MSKNSKIEWTHHTWNPWRGCAHAVLTDGRTHPGCDHCYAEAMARRNPAVLGVWGEHDAGGTRVLAARETFLAPLKWNAQAKAAGERQRVFLDSMHDLFEDWQGPILDHIGCQVFVFDGVLGDFPINGCPATMDDVRREVFQVIDQCPWLDFLILTKRPGNINRYWRAPIRNALDFLAAFPNGFGTAEQVEDGWRPNVWLGTSISDQPTANELVPQLLAAHDLAPVRFVSAEPLLSSVRMSEYLGVALQDAVGIDNGGWPVDGINWVIAGGESGPSSRPMHPEWVRSLRDQCVTAGVPFFFKQWGAWLPEAIPGTHADLEQLAANQQVAYGDGSTHHVRFTRVGKTAAGRLLDGREWNEFPDVSGVTNGSEHAGSTGTIGLRNLLDATEP